MVIGIGCFISILMDTDDVLFVNATESSLIEWHGNWNMEPFLTSWLWIIFATFVHASTLPFLKL